MVPVPFYLVALRKNLKIIYSKNSLVCLWGPQFDTKYPTEYGGVFLGLTMADLEAVLADVSYLMAMEKSKCTPAAR
jgi:hypothetical protein